MVRNALQHLAAAVFLREEQPDAQALQGRYLEAAKSDQGSMIPEG